MIKTNYQLICDKEIEELTCGGKTPKLLLHSCCGPCSSYVLEYLSKYFEISLLFFNPNISPKTEYFKRLETQRQLISSMKFSNKVSMIESKYNHNDFLSAVSGYENEPEGGSRCELCFKIRLREAARIAKEMNFDCFTTTLSVSPHKNAALLNDIGKKLSEEFDIKFLTADFKKREGYKRSIILSKEYGLYRQEYCGCEFSFFK